MTQHQHPHSSSKGIIKYATLVLVLLFGTSLDAHAQDRREQYSVVGVAENDTLNVRSRPGESSSIVAKLRNGTAGIEIIGRTVMNGDDDWVPVAISGVKGWVRPKFLSSKSEQIVWADVPIRRAAAVNSNEADSDAELPQPDTVSNDPYGWVKPAVAIFSIFAVAYAINDMFNSDSSPTDSGISTEEANRSAIIQMRTDNAVARSRGEVPPYSYVAP